MPEARRLHRTAVHLWALIGDTLYRITSNKVQTPIGTIGTSTGAAYIASDGTNICVVDNSKGYYGTIAGSSLTEISFPDSFVPNTLAYIDGYFIVGRKDTDRFYISSSYDPSTWSATDYASAEGKPDYLTAIYALNRDLYLFGPTTTEIWFNSGNAAFPFERYAGGFYTVGCESPRSIANTDDALFWLDDDWNVRMGSGVQSKVISTPSIAYQIASLSDHDLAIGFCYSQEGHTFYQLTFDDGADTTGTFVYDITTGYWHTRASGSSDIRHPAQCHEYFASYNIVGHYSTGRLLYIDPNVYTLDGEVMRSIRSAQCIHSDRDRVYHSRFELDVEAGVGNSDCPEPVISLDWSDDNGNTFSTPQERRIGASGEYSTRVFWNRLGQARARVYRATIDDPVKRVILAAHLEGGKGGK